MYTNKSKTAANIVHHIFIRIRIKIKADLMCRTMRALNTETKTHALSLPTEPNVTNLQGY